MDLRPRKLETVKEDGWHIVPNTWWQTSFESVSWAYSPDDNSPDGHFRGSLFGSLSSSSGSTRLRHRDDDLVLSAGLYGVQCALDALVLYERDVGFPVAESLEPKPRVDISIPINEEAIARGKELWQVYATALMSGSGEPTNLGATPEEFTRDDEASRTPSPSSSQGGLHRSTSTLSSVDLTDSDLSFKSSSPPSTPKKKNTEAIVVVKETSPVKPDHHRYIIPSGRPLNAAASSFVPSSIPSKAETESFSFAAPASPKPKAPSPPIFSEFTFPSLVPPPLPTVTIKKDEHGFYSEAEVAAPVPQSQKETCTFLPPFLKNSSRRKAPASKTRAMVDRLRSSHNHSHSPAPNPPLYDLNLLEERVSVSEDDRTQISGISSPSSQEGEDDGWINLTEVDTSNESKARRTRDLFLALTKRRSDSTPPGQNDDASKDEHQEIKIPMTTSPVALASPLPSTDDGDGWIDGSALRSATEATPRRRTESRPRSHRRRRSSHAPQMSPTTATATSSQYIPVTSTRAPVAVTHTHHSYQPQAPIYPSSNPTSYFYSAYMPPAMYTSYMQQLQLMQLQMRSGGGGTSRRTSAPTSTAEWFQYPTAGAPFTTTTTPAPQLASPAPAARRDSLW